MLGGILNNELSNAKYSPANATEHEFEKILTAIPIEMHGEAKAEYRTSIICKANPISWKVLGNLWKVSSVFRNVWEHLEKLAGHVRNPWRRETASTSKECYVASVSCLSPPCIENFWPTWGTPTARCKSFEKFEVCDQEKHDGEQNECFSNSTCKDF